jgi:hypothetical protein
MAEVRLLLQWLRSARRARLETSGAIAKPQLPVELVYAAEFDRIDEAFWFEKQVQGWSRAKREALIRGGFAPLPALSRCGHRPATERRSASDPSSRSGG